MGGLPVVVNEFDFNPHELLYFHDNPDYDIW